MLHLQQETGNEPTLQSRADAVEADNGSANAAEANKSISHAAESDKCRAEQREQSKEVKLRGSMAVYAGIGASLFLLLLSFLAGAVQGKLALALPLVTSSLLLEVVIGAAGSIPLGFDPVSGALVSALANLAPVPALLVLFEQLVDRWTWLNRKLQKSANWSDKYGKYGVWVLVPLSPFFGAYACVAIGAGLRWHPLLIFTSISLGVLVSAFLTTFGGGFLFGD